MKQALVLQAVRDGVAEIPTSVEVVPGVFVWSDALKIGGVRVGVSARTTQQVADLLGLSPTTPEIEDAIDAAAVGRVDAFTFSPSKHDITGDQVERLHSEKIDQELQRKGIEPGALFSTVGKAWVLSPILLTKRSRGANYGWHSQGARGKPVTHGSRSVWQPLSTVHNLDHHDYSQTLRLCWAERELPGCEGLVRFPGVDPLEPLVVKPSTPSHGTSMFHGEEVPLEATTTFGQLCVDVARAEMERELNPSPATVARYHGVAIRNGKPLGIKTGNHCASAASYCALVASRQMASPPFIPHQPRAAARELMADAIAVGCWHARAQVLGGHYRPTVGDLAIYDRSVRGRPETAWWGHVDRVSRVLDAQHYEAIGANEVAGAWRVDLNRLDHPRLLGFVGYSDPPRFGIVVTDPFPVPPDACG